MKRNTFNTIFSLVIMLTVSIVARANNSVLIEPKDLAKEVNDGAVILDLRTRQPSNDLTILPNSISSPFSEWRGPAENPGSVLTQSHANTLFGGLGIQLEDRIILATSGENNSAFGAAARAFWDLTSFGFHNVGILHGGVASYKKANHAFAESYDIPKFISLSLNFDSTFYASSSDLLKVIEGSDSIQLLDARPQSWHDGKKWHAASLSPGTLEGSKVVDYRKFFQSPDTSRLKSVNEISNLLKIADIRDDNISFCESGWWSAGNWFIINNLSGFTKSRLYPEGRIHWSRNKLPQVNVPTAEELRQLKLNQT